MPLCFEAPHLCPDENVFTYEELQETTNPKDEIIRFQLMHLKVVFFFFLLKLAPKRE